MLDKIDQNIPRWMFWKRRRIIVAIFAALGFAISYALRVNLSIAIIEMTEIKRIKLDNCTVVNRTEFDWDSGTQGHVLSSFYYGYFASQLFWGWIAGKFGGVRVFGGGQAAVAALTLLTPWLSRISVYLLIFLRIVEGFFAGVTMTAVSEILAKWAPPLERSRFMTFIYSGIHVGILLSMSIFAYLSKTWGWPSIFYFSGGCALIWFVFWCISVKETPVEDPRISQQELDYITESLKNTPSDSLVTYPWKAIFTSMPVWGITVAHVTQNWFLYLFEILFPKILKDKFQFQISEIGMLSSLPFLVMAVMLQVVGVVADWLQKKHILSTTNVRKIFTCGAFLSAAILLQVSVVLKHPIFVVTCFILAAGCDIFTEAGGGVNHLDIGPRYASVIMGIINTAAELTGILLPIMAGYIVKTPTAEEWNILFYITSFILVFAAAFYGTFASGEMQPWAVEDKKPGTVLK